MFHAVKAVSLSQIRSYSTKMTTPVVLCGASKAMGARVTSKLLPQLEVIQFIKSVERAKSEIPTLMAGKQPPPDPDNLGSHDFSRPPRAVIFGRGFERDAVEEIRQACGGSESKLAWLSAGAEGLERAKANPPSRNDPEALDAYAESTVAEIKKIMDDLKAEGREGVDGTYYY